MKLFGAALDVLPHPEKIAVKRAYLGALRTGHIRADDPRDPYDALLPILASGPLSSSLEPHGKFPVPSPWRPKPDLEDLSALDPVAFQNFFAAGTCGEIAGRLKEWVQPLLLVPDPLVMVGVDHGLTGGLVTALSEMAGSLNEKPALVVFDGHLDAISPLARDRLHAASLGQNPHKDDVVNPAAPYTCQTFVKHLLDNDTVDPENLIVAGIYALPGPELRRAYGRAADLYCEEHRSLQAAGVTLLSRDQLRADPHALQKSLDKLKLHRLYVSLDLDVCASHQIPAVRFPDATGLTRSELIALAHQVAHHCRKNSIHLTAVDVMEIDTHLLDLAPYPGITNQTVHTAAAFLETLLFPA